MPIIVSHRIRELEFGPVISAGDRDVLRHTARLALAAPLAGKGLPPGTRLLKAYGTSSRGPRRVVYLLAVADADLFLMFYRDKNDPIGANASPRNPAFSAQLKKHLALLREDIESGRFDTIDVSSP